MIATALLAVAIIACAGEPRGTSCPGQFDPSKLSQTDLQQIDIATIPRREATTAAEVSRAIAKSRRFIEQNYAGVVEVGTGRGWGVSYTQDVYGNDTFHHTPDHMVVAVVAKRSDCPDPSRGTLFVYGADALRTPVRFLYRKAG
jgi:hypothetical protein